MRIALMYSGLVRTLAYTWPITQAQFSRYETDVYCYFNETEKESLVQSLVHPVRMVVEPDQRFPEEDYAKRLGPGVNDVQNDLRQLNGLMRVNQLRRSTGIAYDWAFRIRADVELTTPPEPLETLDRSFIYIPRFRNWFGYNDKFAFGPPHLMDIYMERFSHFNAYFQGGGEFQMESFLAFHLRDNRVKVARTQAIFNTRRSETRRDPPYWGQGWGDCMDVTSMSGTRVAIDAQITPQHNTQI
jgi:hypothetical protein